MNKLTRAPKLAVWQIPAEQSQALAKLGVVPQNIPAGDIYSSLERGTMAVIRMPEALQLKDAKGNVTETTCAAITVGPKAQLASPDAKVFVLGLDHLRDGLAHHHVTRRESVGIDLAVLHHVPIVRIEREPDRAR